MKILKKKIKSRIKKYSPPKNKYFENSSFEMMKEIDAPEFPDHTKKIQLLEFRI